jgi:HEAT repeat protein
VTENPTPKDIIRLIEERGRDGREFLFDLDLPDKIDRLCSALEVAESAHVRRVISNLLASLADPAALPCLLDRLNDPDPDVVAAAADAIGNSSYDQDIPDDLRTRLGTALLGLASDRTQPLHVRTGAIYGLGLMRYRPALIKLLMSLESDEAKERLASAEALAHIGDPSAISALRVRRVRETDPAVKRYVGLALATLTESGS